MADHTSVSLLFIESAQVFFVTGALTGLLLGKKIPQTVLSSILFAGCLALLVGACIPFPAGFTWSAAAPLYLGLAPLENRVDCLSSLFLIILSVVGMSISLFSPAYLDHLKDRINLGFYWFCLFLFIIGMVQVVLSANAITFLVFWELMSLSSVALVASEPARHRSQRAALIYLGATRISTAFLTAGFIWMHTISGENWDFSKWNMHTPDALVPACLILLGLCIKAGLWPFHISLPYVYPEAPSPVSALMSGVMVKVAMYAMLRVLIMGDCFNPVVAYTLLGLGVISAAWGVLFALMQRDLKILLAYSTLENVGLICAGMGLAIICRQAGFVEIADIALAGVFLHIVNHALFKSLLFLGAGCIEATAHTRDLSLLGGLARTMPLTLLCFFIGSVAICAMPPLNGFASKWLFYQSFFQSAIRFDDPALKAMALTIVGIMSFVGALSLASFSKAVGIAFLGRARTSGAIKAHEASSGMLVAQGLLASLCVISGLAAPVLLGWLQPVVSAGLDRRADLSAVLTVPLAPLAIVGATLALVAYTLVLAPANRSLKKYITWDCGYGELPTRAEETGSSFSQPIGRIFSSLLQYKMTTEIGGKDRRHFPESIKVEVLMLSFIESRVYRPMIDFFRWISSSMVRLQTGSIHIHLLYVFVTMLLVIYVGSVLGDK